LITRRRTATVVSVLLGASLVAAACGSDSKSSSTTTAASGTSTSGAAATSTTAAARVPTGTITYAAEQEFSTYNNNTADGNAFANTLVLNGVQPSAFYFDDKAAFVMDKNLMVSADVSSGTPQVVTYKVNPKANWSDGVPIDCKDWYLAWIAQNGKAVAKNPDGTAKKDADGKDVPLFSPASTTGYEQISKVECSDNNKTIVTTYETPFGDWKGLFSALMPAHVVEAKTGVTDVTKATADADLAKVADFWNTGWVAEKYAADTYISGGPYAFSKLEKGVGITLAANDKYFGQAPAAANITFKLIDDATQQPAALANGEVQVITPQPNPDLLAQLEGQSGTKITNSSGFTFEHYDWNFKSTMGADPAVRQAFAYCLPRQDIVTKLIVPLNPDAKVLNNRMFIPSQSDYKDNSGQYANQDIAKAKSTLEAAGWTLNGGVYEKAGKKLEFKIAYRDPNPRRQQEVQLVAAACKDAGMNITAAPDKDLFSKILPSGTYDMALFAWVGSPLTSSQKALYATDGDSNYGKYSNPDVDTWLTQVNGESDASKQGTLLNQADVQIWKDLYTYPVFQFPDLTAYSDKIENVLYNPTQSGITWNVYDWAIAK